MEVPIRDNRYNLWRIASSVLMVSAPENVGRDYQKVRRASFIVDGSIKYWGDTRAGPSTLTNDQSLKPLDSFYLADRIQSTNYWQLFESGGDLMKRFIVPVFLACWMAMGCAGSTNRVHVDETGGVEDTGIDSQDLRTIVQRMARSIIQINAIATADSPPRIAFLDIKNSSNDILDTGMFLRKIRTLLLKHSQGRIRFIDRARVREIIKEREAKRAGLISSAGSKNLAGADYFLTGNISSIDKAAGDLRSTYTLVSFRLTDAETSDIIWEDEYEMKKVGKRAFWDY
jgi:penicillin-binding protein activator